MGIVALNLLAPGLGVLRLSKLGSAAALLVAYPAMLLLFGGLLWLFPRLDFAEWAGMTTTFLVLFLVLLSASFALSWRGSRFRETDRPWWSRWYGLLGAWLLWIGLTLLTPDLRSFYRTFYLPADAMSPTLLKNDRLVASMRPGPLRRGDIILFNVGDHVYVKRVAALPGDSIEMRNGLVVLNGRPVEQRLLGIDRVQDYGFGTEARRLAEQFPGEAGPHEIYDLGRSLGDEFAEQRVAPGHVFVLGDNRDQSADSRYPRAEMGVEQLPISDVIGTARFIFWRPGSGVMGTSLTGE